MIDFSWKKINDKFDWNAHSVVIYFYLKQNLKIPPFMVQEVPKKVSTAILQPYPKGPCFLINPKEVLLAATDAYNLYMYLELASMRNVFDYLVRGVRYLPLVMVPKYLAGWLEANPLLKIENDKVYFKYEQE